MLIPADSTSFALRHVSGLFLGIQDNAKYPGAEAVLTHAPNASDIANTPVAQWRLQQHANASYLLNVSSPGNCLNVAYESKDVGGSLQQWTCNGGASESWSLVPTMCGTFVLLNRNSRLAVGSLDSQAGSQVTQVNPCGNVSAHWIIVEAKSPANSEWGQRKSKLSSIAGFPLGAASLADEMIYNVYIPIYSPSGRMSAVTEDLPRIAELGFSTILLMPIHPMGVPTGGHPAVGSPYAVSDFCAIDSALGELSDFANLMKEAHSLGVKVLMDVVLNHTAWNHRMILERPEYYVHTNHRKSDPNSIAQAFRFEDVAQLDYKSGDAVSQYMSGVLKWWMDNFQVDGFRFDTVDNPSGKNRMIPAQTWTSIGETLRAVNPNVILLGECCNPELSLKPFNLDYVNYNLQPAVMSAIKSQDARNLSRVVDDLKRTHPAGMLHTSIMQTWDMDLDLNMYGGPHGTLVAAVFNFTIEGVPMIFAGEEAGNDQSSVNTHAPINWNSSLSPRFKAFYTNLGALRRMNEGLRRGSTTWLRTSAVAGNGLISFLRRGRSQECFIAINFSASSLLSSASNVVGAEWVEVTPPGGAGFVRHVPPPSISLGPRDFMIFTRVL